MGFVSQKVVSFRFVCFLIMLFLVSASNVVCANEKNVEMFLNDVLQRNPIAVKWNVDIRYHTIGLGEEESHAFDRIASGFSEVLNVGLSREDTNVNVLFVFSGDMDSDLRRKKMYQLFSEKDESYDAYLDRVIVGRNGADEITKANFGRDSINNYFSMVDVNALEEDRSVPYNRIILRMLFGFLSGTNVDIDSSLSWSAECRELSKFDLLFVESYYSNEIKHGMGVEAAKQVLIKKMVK